MDSEISDKLSRGTTPSIDDGVPEMFCRRKNLVKTVRELAEYLSISKLAIANHLKEIEEKKKLET